MAWREELRTVKVGKRIAKLKRTREQIAGLAALAEHARAVRIVRREMGRYQRQREVEKNQIKRDVLAGSILACVGVLAALQKGRA